MRTPAKVGLALTLLAADFYKNPHAVLASGRVGQ
jgi:hypothetical protein